MGFTAYILKSTLNDLSSNFDTLRNTLSLPPDFGKIMVYFIYSFLICICIVSAIGAFGIICCKKLHFKYVIYIGCIFFFVFGVFAFLFSILFSYLVPTLNWTCNFLDTALESKTGFIGNFLII